MAVSVVDNGQAQLEATATYTPEASFSNTYKAAAASLVVKASKTLNGGTLAADQFTFELVDQNGKVVQTAKNKADGTVEFPAVSFDAAGNYNFKIREKNEGAAGYTYDATEFDVAVAVADNGKGQLVVSKKENTSGVVFVNLLADNTPNQQGPGKPEEKKEEKKLPKTGESSSILLIGLGFVLVIAAVVVLFTRKNARN